MEDTELARASAVKAKQKIIAELNETTSHLEDANRIKGEAESRAQAAARQVNTLKTQLEENEEELSEVILILIFAFGSHLKPMGSMEKI